MYGTGLKKVEDPASPYFGRTIFSSGLPVADEKLVPLGNYNPDFILGVTNELSFKNFSLSFLFDWRQGGDLLSRIPMGRFGQVEDVVGAVVFLASPAAVLRAETYYVAPMGSDAAPGPAPRKTTFVPRAEPPPGPPEKDIAIRIGSPDP